MFVGKSLCWALLVLGKIWLTVLLGMTTELASARTCEPGPDFQAGAQIVNTWLIALFACLVNHADT